MTSRAGWITAILLLTALAYGPSLDAGLTNWDDGQYVTSNPFLRDISWANTSEIFRSYYKGNYHPLTMLSLSVDYAVGGDAHVLVHHSVNLLLHLANTWLVFLCIDALFRRRELAIVTALLFGLHPMHVESVAWVSERKDVLSACFYLLALRLYIAWARTAEGGERIAWSGLGACFFAFLLALLSKGTAVALAPTLLTVDYALGRSLRSPRVLLEKLPFFALALAFGWVALLAQSSAGQLQGVSQWTAFQRILIAGYGFTEYLRLLVVPTQLSAFYPYPDHTAGSLPMVFWIRSVAALGVAGVFVWSVRRNQLLAFAIAFFALNLALVLQLIPIGGAIMADRYGYLPSIGLFLAMAAACAWIAARSATARSLVLAGVALYAGTLGVQTYARCQVWHDSLSLWNDTLAKHDGIPTAWLNRALARHASGDLPGAEEDLGEAIRLEPGMARAWSNRGAIRLQRGDLVGARADLDRSIVLAPTADAYVNRGAVRLTAGDYDGSIRDFGRALGSDPRNPTTWTNRGIAQAALGRYGAALEDFAMAISLQPAGVEAHYQSGEARRRMGNPRTALLDLDNALRLQPGHSRALLAKGRTLLALGRRAEACDSLREAVRLGEVDASAALATACNG